MTGNNAPHTEVLQLSAEVLRLLADPTRLELLRLLDGTEVSVTDLAAKVQRPVPAVSQHLAKLRAPGLVTMRRNGRQVLYCQNDQHLARMVIDAMHFAEHRLYEVPPHHAAPPHHIEH